MGTAMPVRAMPEERVRLALSDWKEVLRPPEMCWIIPH
jgi:hypothetical protein